VIQIKPRILDAIYRHALSSYPSECCGIVIGKKDAIVAAHRDRPIDLAQVFPCRNVYDDMHACDAAQFPRTSKTAYFIDPKDLFNVQKMARERGMEMKMIYHSHVDVGAYFSEEDKRQALMFVGAGSPSPGEATSPLPVYPGVYYFVVDITKDQVRGAKLFGWNVEKKDWAELSWS
jgi:adenylyltransferase/sulfurtransferase